MRLFSYVFLIILLLNPSVRASDVRSSIYNTAISQLTVRELTGNNDGPEIDKFNDATGAPHKSPYCGGFVCWCLKQNHLNHPCSAAAQDYFKDSKMIIYDCRIGLIGKVRLMDTFGMWFKHPLGIHHIGFIISWGRIVETIEGNTSDINTGNGTREGSGVYHKKRLRNQIYQISTYSDV